MPELNGIEAARSIRKAFSPTTEILILSVHYSDQLIREILEAGVRGYIMKSDPDHDLINALEKLAKPQAVFHIEGGRGDTGKVQPVRLLVPACGKLSAND